MKLFRLMHGHFGDPGWWPGKTRFEVIVGAVLTQQTTWLNVERAILNLETADILTLDERRSIHNIASCDFREMIRCTGYYNQKFSRLRHICSFLLEEWTADLDAFFMRPARVIREDLLALRGIGKETADSILLYAAVKPVFVIDAYTFRLMGRLGVYSDGGKNDYDAAQHFFMENLAEGDSIAGGTGGLVKLYQDYHALIVLTSKDFCRKKPHCENCPLEERCALAGKASGRRPSS